MPIAMRHNETLELTRVDFYGRILPEHVNAYGSYGRANQAWIGFDCITFVSSDCDVSALSTAYVSAFFDSFGELLQASRGHVRRRTGWVCDDVVCEQLLSLWLAKRNADSEPSDHVRLFSTAEAASQWLQLSPEGAAALLSGEGFTEIARFDGAASASR